ncbi:hypothetical protein LCGC14_3120950 [marine sediment metagenome]|uniref:DksA C4-type domain-containing protein n=1 Tax=marine sediment metagenome TaxID=412755 RepID=A0A0F8Y9Q8_9ZZZZ
MMNKKRTISIKDPRLQRIRNSLRYIILEAATEEISRMMNERREIVKKLQNNSENKGLYEKKLELIDKIDKLRTAWDKSICVCPICGSRVNDMTFNPASKSWYCVKCYQEHHEFYVVKARQGEIWKNGGGRSSTEWFP